MTSKKIPIKNTHGNRAALQLHFVDIQGSLFFPCRTKREFLSKLAYIIELLLLIDFDSLLI
jgi:hypothetical protein